MPTKKPGKRAASAARRGKRLWEFEPGEVRLPPQDAQLFEGFIRTEVDRQLAHYRLSLNGAFVWRAWRCARLLPEIPKELLVDFMEYFDESARGVVRADTPVAVAQALRMSNPSGGGGEGNRSTSKQSMDLDLLLRFDHLSSKRDQHGALPLKKSVYERIGKELDTTGPAIEQRLIRIRKALDANSKG